MFVGFLLRLICFNVKYECVVLYLNNFKEFLFFVIYSFLLFWYVILFGYLIFFVLRIDWFFGLFRKYFWFLWIVCVFFLYFFVSLEMENFKIILNIFVIKFLLIGWKINFGVDSLSFLGRCFNVEFLFLYESVFVMFGECKMFLFDLMVFWIFVWRFLIFCKCFFSVFSCVFFILFVLFCSMLIILLILLCYFVCWFLIFCFKFL